MVLPQFIDHLVFRVSDMDKSESFYTALLGPAAHKGDDFFIYQVASTSIFFTRCDQPSPGPYWKDNIGLNHIAFGVRTPEELQTIESQLNASGISHSGIRLDFHGKKDYIWLDDPDGMRVEFYLRAV